MAKLSNQHRELTYLERFHAYAKPCENGCWEWTGNIVNKYGQMSFNHKKERAHRVSWLLFKGEIPPGQFVCHTCDNRICVNPEHLFLTDHIGNMKDRNTKGRQMHGEQHHLTHLTEAQIKLIRLDTRPIKTIAEEYGVHFETINSIRHKKTWKHVDGEPAPIRRLTEAQVIAIRLDPRPNSAVAAELGVSRSTISHIRTGRNWKHL
jgi:transposase